ncbi:acetyltransferase domain-containing protein, putative [Eimeria praecox]|uniref:Acetyltransferase domain-containing protein, putative n=1 Tax=Eimeria praecox TaxID=51316 RepID=U6GLI3_9EIME|nr:acetyltransferase domain-containing protein, putative [Eimeria praecox]
MRAPVETDEDMEEFISSKPESTGPPASVSVPPAVSEVEESPGEGTSQLLDGGREGVSPRPPKREVETEAEPPIPSSIPSDDDKEKISGGDSRGETLEKKEETVEGERQTDAVVDVGSEKELLLQKQTKEELETEQVDTTKTGPPSEEKGDVLPRDAATPAPQETAETTPWYNTAAGVGTMLLGATVVMLLCLRCCIKRTQVGIGGPLRAPAVLGGPPDGIQLQALEKERNEGRPAAASQGYSHISDQQAMRDPESGAWWEQEDADAFAAP